MALKRVQQMFLTAFLICSGLQRTASLYVASAENGLQGTHLARLLTVAQVRQCDTFRTRCLNTDCSFVLACTEACSGDIISRLQCLTECNKASSSKEGQDALRDYKSCAGEAAESAAIVRVQSSRSKLASTGSKEVTTEAFSSVTAVQVQPSQQPQLPTDTYSEAASAQAIVNASFPSAIAPLGPALSVVNSEGGAEPSEESVKAIARFKSLLRGHADIEKATGGTTKAAAGAQANAEYSVPGSATMMKAASGAASAAATAAKAVAAAASVARKAMQGMFEGGFTKSAPAPTFADIETCVGCQYVWEKVRMNLGKSDNLDAIMQTFEATCQDMPDIFYEPCDDMVDQKMWFAAQYAKGADTRKMCDGSGICGAKGATTLDSDFEATKPSMMKSLMTG